MGDWREGDGDWRGGDGDWIGEGLSQMLLVSLVPSSLEKSGVDSLSGIYLLIRSNISSLEYLTYFTFMLHLNSYTLVQ